MTLQKTEILINFNCEIILKTLLQTHSKLIPTYQEERSIDILLIKLSVCLQATHQQSQLQFFSETENDMPKTNL